MKFNFRHIDMGHVKLVVKRLASSTGIGVFIFMGAYFSHVEAQNFVYESRQLVKEVPFDPTTLSAKAAIVYDASTGDILFAKNDTTQLPLASLTKLMSAETILSINNESTHVAITPRDLSPEGDSGLGIGETWSLRNLILFGLVASSNDAMAAAAATVGDDMVNQMNLTAVKLGLENSYFLNPTGLDVDEHTAGAYGSARDIARLAASFLRTYPDLFGATAHSLVALSGGNHVAEATSTSGPILDIPGLIGAKTGFTDLAGGNLVAAFDAEIGHPIVVAVLGSTREGRFEDVRALIEATRAALREQ